MTELIKALEIAEPLLDAIPENARRQTRELITQAESTIKPWPSTLLPALIGYRAGKESMWEELEDLEHRMRGLESALDEAANKWVQIGGDLESDLPLVAMGIATRPIAQPASNNPDSIEQPVAVKELHSTPGREKHSDPSLHSSRCICEDCIIAREAKEADEYFNSPEPEWQEFRPSLDNPTRDNDEWTWSDRTRDWRAMTPQGIGETNPPGKYIYRRRVTNQEGK